MEMQEIITSVYNQITIEKVEEFEKFRALLLEYNQKYNLTTILEKQDVYYKHFLDSGVGAHLFKENASVAEIGSGAGFPSIVLKILRPDLKLSLFESVGKKCEFLKVIVDNFNFKEVNIYNMRAEDAGRDKRFRDKFDYVTARAVARMNSLSEYCLPLVKPSGEFIAYKSGDVTEIEEAKSAYKALNATLKNVIKYELPNSYGERSLAIVKKTDKTPNKYPRGQGQERKNPL